MNEGCQRGPGSSRLTRAAQESGAVALVTTYSASRKLRSRMPPQKKFLNHLIEPEYGCLFVVFFHVRSPRRVADANAPVTVYALSIVNVLGAPANGNPADRSFGFQRDCDRMRLAGSVETIRTMMLCSNGPNGDILCHVRL